MIAIASVTDQTSPTRILRDVNLAAGRVADAMSSPDAKDDSVTSEIADMMCEMSKVENDPSLGPGVVSLPLLLNHIVVARGLYAASRKALADNDLKAADRHNSLGDLFLHYAVLDIGSMAQLTDTVMRTTGGAKFKETVNDCKKALVASGRKGGAKH